MLEIRTLDLDGVLVVTPKRFSDRRGYFSETYSKTVLARVGIAVEFVQDNESRSSDAGTIRGLHFQTAPRAQAKLVRVARGAILDVAVDVRRSSATFGKWTGAMLTAERGEQLFVPAGFAHGFCTLQPDTVVLYKVSDFYSPEHEHGIRWDDPAIGISWPEGLTPVLSDKDQINPLLKDSPCMP